VFTEPPRLQPPTSNFQPPASNPKHPDGETGQTFIVMLLAILPLLILVLGVTHDMGNAAAAAVLAQDAADLAACEAGKLVDVVHFVEWEEIRLRPEAVLVAQQVADGLTQGAFQVDAVYLQSTLIVVEGRVTVHTPFLEAFLGWPSVTRAVQGVARVGHGAEGEGE